MNPETATIEFKLSATKTLLAMTRLGKEIQPLNNEAFDAMVETRAKDKAVREETENFAKFIKGQEWYMDKCVEVLAKDKFVEYFQYLIAKMELDANIEDLSIDDIYAMAMDEETTQEEIPAEQAVA